MPASAPAPCPPDMRVLCRKLKSIEPAQLPRAVPSLIGHVLRCKGPLAAPTDAKTKDASESALLAHQFKTTITTLLNGRSREARFAAIALVKAVVQVGGWEVLKTSDSWIRGLLSIVQKSDPIASKELAIVTLTRIYTLLHPYQTLVREIAPPTLPAFITACLQNTKSGEPPSPATQRLLETICECFSALIPLYSNTFRPQSTQIKTAVRPYLAPTSHDIPASLSSASRRLFISLHYIAGKNSGSDDWAKLVADITKELHLTADQVLRAIDEAWEPSSGYESSHVDLQSGVKSGDLSPNELPPWTGVDAGIERLTGLFHYLAECLANSTKASVTIPIEGILDTVSRVCLLARLSPKTQTWEQALQTKSRISREEKEELWSRMPDIHVAALGVVQTLLRRMGDEVIQLVPEVLDHLVRVFNSGIDIPAVRIASYEVLYTTLLLTGPSLSKPVVTSLTQIVRAVCRELQQDAGVLAASKSSPADTKKNGTANADVFLQSKPNSLDEKVTLEPDHKEAAMKLLALLLSHLPQNHLATNLRGLVDKTAILTSNRGAMVASVLNPFIHRSGRIYPSILPHLCRMFPSDQTVEVLRTNLRTDVPRAEEKLDAMDEDEEEDDGDDGENGFAPEVGQDPEATGQPAKADELDTPTLPAAPQIETTLLIQTPGQPEAVTTYGGFGDLSSVTSPGKRKIEQEEEPTPAKRQVVKQSPEPEPISQSGQPATASIAPDVDNSDSDESIHLDGTMSDEDE